MTYQSETGTLSDSGLMQADAAINHVEVIETVISSLEEDQSAMVSHSDKSYLWKFKYGTVEVFVQLTGNSDEDTFTVWSTVLALPAKDEPALMRKLLELNWSGTFEARFGIFDNAVVVTASRTVAGLSAAEVSRNITIVATLADDHDGPLQAEYGMS